MGHEGFGDFEDVGDEIVTLGELHINPAQGFKHLVAAADDGGVPEVADHDDGEQYKSKQCS